MGAWDGGLASGVWKGGVRDGGSKIGGSKMGVWDGRNVPNPAVSLIEDQIATAQNS